MHRRSRDPKAVDREALQDEADEAGDETGDEECTDGPYRPAEAFAGEETVVKEENPDFDEG